MKEVVLKLAKFGGSSLACGDQCKKVIDIIKSDSERRIIVVSAPGKRNKKDHKITDMLYLIQRLTSIGMDFREVFKSVEERYVEIANKIAPDLDIKKDIDEIQRRIYLGETEDYITSRGEYLMAKILSHALGYEFIDAEELFIFNKDRIVDIEKVSQHYEEIGRGKRIVVPGFYGRDLDGNIVTFDRGGSDISGSILAAAVPVDLYENWTDVSGFLACDPSIVKDPVPIRLVSYEELHELSYMGAQVLHEDAIEPAKKADIPIQILNTNKPQEEGTRLVAHVEKSERAVTGLAGKKGFSVINIKRPHSMSAAGFFRRICSIFEANECDIEHMPTSIDTVSLVVSDVEFKAKEKKILEEVDIFCDPDDIEVTSGLSLLAIVGEGMNRREGVSAKAFQALADSGINIRMISQGSSELNIIVGVSSSQFKEAIRALYRAFFE